MTPRAAPGPQLATGRLRVDAARAIAKLREYRLALRAAWVLEAIRAAVASGATRIALHADANDLWLSWDGPPWPAAELPRLFDELVGPEASDDRYPARLLAAAVNSALGSDPAYVDVYAVSPGGAARARYTPDVLDEPVAELAEAPLRKITVEPAAPPPGAGVGMAVHLRRRFGLAVLSHLVREPPELELARAACADLAVPLLVRGAPLGDRAGSRDVARVPLGEGLTGFVAALDPAAAPARPALEVAEHGVALEIGEIGAWFPDGRPVPLRVFVDGPRMPTNASRSEVRRDVHPVSTALRRARALLPALAERLAAALAEPPPAGRRAGDAAPGAQAERARAAALALVAAAGVDAARELGLGQLLELPLLRDAVGAPRAPSAGWSALVHTGARPLPAELAPWLGDMVWIPPGDPAACLVDPEAVDAAGVRRLVRWARHEHRAERRFYSHAPRPPVVEARARPRLRAPLGVAVPGSCIAAFPFQGLTGEICIRGGGGGGGELVLLLTGRELERTSYQSPIGFDAVIDAPQIVATDRYRSALRDAEYIRVELAMRAGVVRALEALAAQHDGDGVVHGEPGPAEGERRLVRAGLRLALEQHAGRGAWITGPLAEAAVWPLAGGGASSTAALRRHAAIGSAAPGAVRRSLPERPIVEVPPGDDDLLAALLPEVRVVPYADGALDGDPADAIDLARGLLEGAGAALALRGPGYVAAITAIPQGGQPRLVISHAGRILEVRAYRPALVPCEIHVDSDHVVPDALWRSALDLAGLDRRFADWERSLLQAGARALAGARPDDLLGFAPVELGDPLGRALCGALAELAPSDLLGEELAIRLAERPLWRLLGGDGGGGRGELLSARDLAARFAGAIPFADAITAAAPDLAVLRADLPAARAAGQLAGRAVRDARPQLEQRLRAAARERKLAEHRLRPVAELALPADAPRAARDVDGVRVEVGVSRGEGLELHLHVEQRPFAVVRRPGEPPLIAIAQVPEDRVDMDFAQVRPAVVDQLVRATLGAAPDLLRLIADERPAALADLGPVRALLAAALAPPGVDAGARAALLSAAAFPTLAGPRASIAAALGGGAVAFAAWDGEWLGPAPGEPADPLDRPVLRVPAGGGELADVIARLAPRVDDVTEAVDRLQAQRRMKRGLLPAPAVHGVPPELKRRLAELGDAGAALAGGLGEIGLVDEPASTALLHVRGAPRDRLAIDVLPAVHLAIEAPDLAAAGAGAGATAGAPELDPDVAALDAVAQLRLLTGRRPLGGAFRDLSAAAQAAAARLVAAVLAEQPAPPAWLRHQLRRALFAGRLAAEVHDVPLFPTVTGAWLDRAALARQIALVGDVWCVESAPADPRPLDERRVVLLLASEEQELGRRGGLPLVDATAELAHDAIARQNLARPPATSLEIHDGGRGSLDRNGGRGSLDRDRGRGSLDRDGGRGSLDRDLLAAVPLDGDGVTAPRGVVAVLAPEAAARRGVLAHRALHPFDPCADPCGWPTLAVVDDARLAPDRTWSRPVRDAAWSALTTAIRNASEAALRELVRRPPGLAGLTVGAATLAGLATLRGDPETQIRGALWFDGPPGTPGMIEIVHAIGRTQLAAPDHIALGGTLYLMTPPPVSTSRLEAVFAELCAAVHTRLLRTLAARRGAPSDLALAHLAYGLALGRLRPEEAPEARFGCFRSRPLGAAEWVALCASDQRVPLVAPDAIVDELSVTNDGTALAKIVLRVLGERAGQLRLSPLPGAPPERLPPTLAIPQPATMDDPFAAALRAPRTPHPLDPVIAAVSARLPELGLAPPRFAILEGEIAPSVRYDGDAICFAAASPALAAIVAACAAGSAWRAAAVDALVAHVVSVLNIALTSVTDATEAHALERLLRAS